MFLDKMRLLNDNH